MIYNNILETIGNTPIVKMQHLGKELKCELYGKCEFFNRKSASFSKYHNPRHL